MMAKSVKLPWCMVGSSRGHKVNKMSLHILVCEARPADLYTVPILRGVRLERYPLGGARFEETEKSAAKTLVLVNILSYCCGDVVHQNASLNTVNMTCIWVDGDSGLRLWKTSRYAPCMDTRGVSSELMHMVCTDTCVLMMYIYFLLLGSQCWRPDGILRIWTPMVCTSNACTWYVQMPVSQPCL